VNPPWQCRTRANSEAKSKHALVGYKTSPSFNVTSSNRMHYIGYFFLPAYVFPFNSCNGIPKQKSLFLKPYGHRSTRNFIASIIIPGLHAQPLPEPSVLIYLDLLGEDIFVDICGPAL
jgi:hypothetical protein